MIGWSPNLPAKNTADILPKTIGKEPVRFIVLDNASDTTNAVKADRRRKPGDDE